MSKPFTEKYRPKTLSDIQGHDTAIAQVRRFVETYSSQKKRGLLLHGAPGSGKTSLAHAIATELGLELVEVNASDVRNKEGIITRVGAAMKQQSLFGGGKIILFDEMDGLSGTKDRGGIAALTDLLKESKYPVLLTANDPWDSKFSTLRKYVEIVELKTLAYTSVLAVLKDVCEKEGIMYSEVALKQLARRAGGDLRGALTDLQTIGADKLIEEDDLQSLGERHQTESTFNALNRVFKGKDPLLAKQAVDAVDENIDELLMWIDENTPREYTKPEDLVRAFDHLSQADVYRGRIRRWQHWRFLVYVIDHMTAGVALAKEDKYSGFTKYQRTTRLLSYWRASSTKKKKDAIAQRVGEETHTSINDARNNTLPFLARMIKKDKKYAEVFELSSDEAEWLVKKI